MEDIELMQGKGAWGTEFNPISTLKTEQNPLRTSVHIKSEFRFPGDWMLIELRIH